MFGIFSAIGSFVSGALSSIGSFLGGLGSALGSVGAGIVDFAKKLVTDIPVTIVQVVVGVIGEIVGGIARALGLVKEEDSFEELGAKAKDAELKPEDFDSTQEYIRYLREDIQLDRQKFEAMSPEDRLACGAVGIGILSQGVSEKKGIDIPVEFWIEVGRQKLKSEEAEALIDQFKLDRKDLGDLGPYLKGELRSSEALSLAPTIERALQQQNPGVTQEDIIEKIVSMKENARQREQ